MKRYKSLKEITTYNKPFWNFLFHLARSKEDRNKIFTNGFIVGQNPNILKGIYTVPDIWAESKYFKDSNAIKLY